MEISAQLLVRVIFNSEKLLRVIFSNETVDNHVN